MRASIENSAGRRDAVNYVIAARYLTVELAVSAELGHFSRAHRVRFQRDFALAMIPRFRCVSLSLPPLSLSLSLVFVVFAVDRF
jgi:hypothetical protein